MKTRIRHFFHLLYLYIVTRLKYIFSNPPKVLDSFSSLKKINEEELSISRYGDGEFSIICGKSIKFQKFDVDLSNRLKEILAIEDKKFKVCIPSIYSLKITRSLKYNEEIFWLEEIKNFSKIYLNKILKKRLFLDACFSRFYIRYKNRDISLQLLLEIKKIWDKKSLLIVEGKYSRLGVGNDLFDNAKSIQRILCPNKNAFCCYDKILNSVVNHYNNQLVLAALGPTATVLAYDLYKKNIRTIDIGHLDLEYEWFLSNATEKQLVNNKVVNEVLEDDNLSDIMEKQYLSSIVEEIKWDDENEI